MVSTLRGLLFLRAMQGLLVMILLMSTALTGSAQTQKRLLSYYPYWAATRTPAYSSAQIPYNKMTHILHAFLALNTNGQGGIVIPQGLLDSQLITKAHAAGVKVIISIGGGNSQQASAFSKIAASDAYRRAFAKNVHGFLSTYGYDGVDIDWEVPNAPHDTQPCTMLMEALRAELPTPRWLISMAVGSDPRYYGTGFDIPALTPLVDFFNVMTYDFHGPWSNHSGHNSPLLLDPSDPGQEGSVSTSIDLFRQSYGVPAQKLNMGTAFYGYEFDAVQNLWNYCACSNTTTAQHYGTYIKSRINLMGWQRFFDNAAQSPYLLNGGTGGSLGMIAYDDAASTGQKTQYVLYQRGLGGVFMWELSADYDGKTQDLLNAMYLAWQGLPY